MDLVGLFKNTDWTIGTLSIIIMAYIIIKLISFISQNKINKTLQNTSSPKCLNTLQIEHETIKGNLNIVLEKLDRIIKQLDELYDQNEDTAKKIDSNQAEIIKMLVEVTTTIKDLIIAIKELK